MVMMATITMVMTAITIMIIMITMMAITMGTRNEMKEKYDSSEEEDE